MSRAAMMLMAGYPHPNIKCDAATFDGTNDLLSRADLVGVSDGGSAIISFWLRVNSGDGVQQTILRMPTPLNTFYFGFTLNKQGGGAFANDISLTGYRPAGDGQLGHTNTGNAQHLAGATWRHVLIAWQFTGVSSGTAHFYSNDVSVSTNTQFGATQSSAFTGHGENYCAIGGTNATYGEPLLNGDLAEFYFAPNQYLDFSIVANRRKFRSVGGKPVHLGTTGALPTGTAPAIYLHLDKGETVANFATNRGTGGNFTVTGALSTASTSPSD